MAKRCVFPIHVDSSHPCVEHVAYRMCVKLDYDAGGGDGGGLLPRLLGSPQEIYLKGSAKRVQYIVRFAIDEYNWMS